MKNRNRFIYQPGLPLGKNGKRVTGGTEHIALSREAAAVNRAAVCGVDRLGWKVLPGMA